MPDYSQPFYVPIDKRHLVRGVNASGYLPALEPKEDTAENPPELILSYQEIKRRLDKVLAESRYWHQKTVELLKSNLDKKKRTPTKYIYSNIVLEEKDTPDSATKRNTIDTKGATFPQHSATSQPAQHTQHTQH